MNIQQNLKHFLSILPKNITLVAVSKTKPISDLKLAYEGGQRIFGENKIQEMTNKWEVLPKDIEWHMIGHVQTNKVKYMAPYVALIHGVDRLKLLKEINKQGANNNRVINCLLQMHIAQEESKFGFSKEELEHVIETLNSSPLSYVQIKGIMGMATFTNNQEQIKKEFQSLKQYSDLLKKYIAGATEISMGMSGDYKLAIEQGSTMVRIGSKIFGDRN